MDRSGTRLVDGQQVARRPVTSADRDVLLEVYAATRAEELTLVDWSEADKRAFVAMQFEAQDRHYREHYPSATFEVIVVDGEPAGRLYVDRWRDEVRIVDIALLPEYRNAGIGTALLREVTAEAAASGRKASIHVEVFNPAIRLYARLGFEPVAERGVHLLMEWAPGLGDDGLVAHAAGVGAEGDEEQGKLAQVGVVEREGLLLDVAPVRGMEEERERDAPDVVPPLLGRAGPGFLALGEHEVDRLATRRNGAEHLPGDWRESRAREVFEHDRQDRRLAPGHTAAAAVVEGELHGHHSS